MYKKKNEDTTVHCLECGREVYGRKGKHFCDQACKNRYWNRRVHEQRQFRMDTMQALTQNYTILDAMIKEERESAPLEELAALGFNANVMTGHRKGIHRHDEYACFDISYYQSGTRIFRLRRKGCVLR